jgi:hypothetical protein
MDTKNFNDYKIADISSEEIKVITDLEKSISTKMNQNIILIAYEPSKKAKN